MQPSLPPWKTIKTMSEKRKIICTNHAHRNMNRDDKRLQQNVLKKTTISSKCIIWWNRIYIVIILYVLKLSYEGPFINSNKSQNSNNRITHLGYGGKNFSITKIYWYFSWAKSVRWSFTPPPRCDSYTRDDDENNGRFVNLSSRYTSLEKSHIKCQSVLYSRNKLTLQSMKFSIKMELTEHFLDP